jgi:hypothetical protein
LKAVRVPDFDEQAVGFSDLSLRGASRKIQRMKRGTSDTESALALNRIAAWTDLHCALPGGWIDATIILPAV